MKSVTVLKHEKMNHKLVSTPHKVDLYLMISKLYHVRLYHTIHFMVQCQSRHVPPNNQGNNNCFHWYGRRYFGTIGTASSVS